MASRTRRRPAGRLIILSGLLGASTLGVARLRRERRAETPPPPPDKLHVVSVQPVGGDPQAFRVRARMSRADGRPILGAFETYADLRDPATGRPLLQRQCSFTMQDAADGRSTEITLTDRLPALPARPVQAEIWIQTRWVPRGERGQWNLWQFTQSVLPHPLSQSEPAEPLTCHVTLPPGRAAAPPSPEQALPPARPRAVRSLLWRTPADPRLAMRR